MPSNNSKYTDEVRERKVLHIINFGKSATAVAEEHGIDLSSNSNNLMLKARVQKLHMWEHRMFKV